MLEKAINKNYILRKIGSENVYKQYLGYFVIGKVMISPFRNEKRPSFIVRINNSGELYHKDYGDSSFDGDCVGLVMKLFHLPYHAALRKICDDFEGQYQSLDRIPKIEVKKVSTTRKIKVEIRDFNTLDIMYWSQYGINQEDISREGIYSISRFWMTDENGEFKEYRAFNELCFGYKFEEGWKIYFPERTEFKWFSSVPNDVVEGWSNIKDFDYLIITKSRKDRMVLSKLCKNVINAQNESTSLLTESHKETFKHFKKVYVFFDSDEPGVKACKKITEEMGWLYVNTPKTLINQGIKDPAEWVKQQGFEPLTKFLKTKKVL